MGGVQVVSAQGFCCDRWCLYIQVVLTLCAILIPVIIQLIPCDKVETIVYQPLDLFFMLDGSGSMSNHDWDLQIDSAQSFVTGMQTFTNDIAMGIAVFGRGATLQAEMKYNPTEGNELLEHLQHPRQDRTDYYSAMDLWETEIAEMSRNGSYSLGVLISDGAPNMNTDKMHRVATRLKGANHTIVGVMVGNINNGLQLFSLSSCGGEYEFSNWEECEYYFGATDFNHLLPNIANIADNVGKEINMVKDTSCIKSPYWWLLLLLLVPVMGVIATPFLVPKQRNMVRRKAMAVAPAPSKMRVPPPPPPKVEILRVKEPPAAVKNSIISPQGPKKYKWEVVGHDNYLWAFSGGVAPMNVNYGAKAPPSAPRDPNAPKVRISVHEPNVNSGRDRSDTSVTIIDTWQDDEGYAYEYIREEITAEQYFEQKFSWCCCCCCCSCCRKKQPLPPPPPPPPSNELSSIN